MTRTTTLAWAGALAVGYALMACILAISTIPDMRPIPRLGLALALAVVVFVHGALVWRLWRSSTPVGLPTVLFIALAFVLILSVTLPAFTDVYSYVGYGRLVAVYDANPATVAPDTFPGDPYFSAIPPEYRDAISVYGPLWNLLGGGVAGVAELLGIGLSGTVWLFRGLIVLSFGACVVLLWHLLGRWLPQRQAAGTILFAWSPLVVIEAAAIHNDFVMTALVVGGVLLASRGHPLLAVALLTMAVLIKFFAGVILLFLVVALISQRAPGRDRWMALGANALVVLLVSVPLYLWLGDPLRSVLSPLSSDAGSNYNSLAEVTSAAITRLGVVGAHDVDLFVRWAAQLMAVAIVVGLAVVVWRRRSLPVGVSAGVVALMVVVLLSGRFWPWYVVVVLALASLAAPAVRAGAVILGYSALSIYALYPLAAGPAALGLLRSLVMVIPVLFVVVWRIRRARSGFTDALVVPESGSSPSPAPPPRMS